MFLDATKATLVKGWRQTFDGSYPIKEFQDLHVSVQYPEDITNFPGLLVDLQITEPLISVAIDPREFEPYEDPDTLETSYLQPVRRWQFAGYAEFTIYSLSTIERDRLFDECIKVLAMGDVTSNRSRFRQLVEGDDAGDGYIGMHLQWDRITVTSIVDAAGTPWGTQDMVSEATLRVEMHGEFVSDRDTGTPVPLSGVAIFDVAPGEVADPPGNDDEDGWS